jgi:hypothetical protein
VKAPPRPTSADVAAAEVEIAAWEKAIREATEEERWRLTEDRWLARRCGCGWIGRAKVRPRVSIEGGLRPDGRVPRPTIGHDGKLSFPDRPTPTVRTVEFPAFRCTACRLEVDARIAARRAEKLARRARAARARQEMAGFALPNPR